MLDLNWAKIWSKEFVTDCGDLESPFSPPKIDDKLFNASEMSTVCCSNILSYGSDLWAFHAQPIKFLILCDILFVAAVALIYVNQPVAALVVTTSTIFIQIVFGIFIAASLLSAWCVKMRTEKPKRFEQF
jgi:hypothetical protein